MSDFSLQPRTRSYVPLRCAVTGWLPSPITGSLPSCSWSAKPSAIWPKVTFCLCYLPLGPKGSCCHGPAGRRPDPGCDTKRERERESPCELETSLGHLSRRPQSRAKLSGTEIKAGGGVGWWWQRNEEQK